MQQLLGNRKLISQIRNAVLEDKTAHAYLLCGADGSGKRTLAGIMAQMILCPQAGCDQCAVCHKVEKGIHPDLIRVHGVTKSGAYSVDQIREIRKDALVYPNEGRKKIYIFEQAEKMSLMAQDAFLKILEEPPAFVVFILLCSDESKMLATVLSRVIRLSLEMPSEKESAAWLREHCEAEPSLIHMALGVAAGNPGRALELIQGGDLEKVAQQCETFCKTLLLQTPYDLAAMSHALAADRTQFARFLEMLSLYLRDILVYKSTGEQDQLIFADSVCSMSSYYARMRTEGIGRAVEQLQQMATLATQPISILLLEMRLVTLVKEELI